MRCEERDEQRRGLVAVQLAKAGEDWRAWGFVVLYEGQILALTQMSRGELLDYLASAASRGVAFGEIIAQINANAELTPIIVVDADGEGDLWLEFAAVCAPASMPPAITSAGGIA